MHIHSERCLSGFPSRDAEDGAYLCGVDAGSRKVVEGFAGDGDDVVADEGRAFAGTLFGVFETALPFEHGPAGVVVLGEFGKDGFEGDLTVADGTEASGAVGPILIAAIDTLAA